MFTAQGEGEDGQELFTVERAVGELAQGKEASLEVPSYELPAPLRALKVTLVSAKFGPEE